MAALQAFRYTVRTMEPDVCDACKPSDEAASGDTAPAAELPASLYRWTGVLLARATQRLRDHAEAELAPIGIRTRHYPVLAVLAESPMTQVEIGRLLLIDRSTMVALIDELEKARLVIRDRHPADRRAYAIQLTDAGREKLQLATDRIAILEAECFSALSPAEQQMLRSLLTRLL